GTLNHGNLPPLAANPTSDLSVVVTPTRDGNEGTVVNPGGTLQLQGNRNMTTEDLTLNGPGFMNRGALDQVAGGSSTWGRAVTLGSNVFISVEGGSDTLTFNQPISDGGSAFGMTKVGPGTVAYTGANNNTYTGLTQVNNGLLSLNKSPSSEVQYLV